MSRQPHISTLTRILNYIDIKDGQSSLPCPSQLFSLFTVHLIKNDAFSKSFWVAADIVDQLNKVSMPCPLVTALLSTPSEEKYLLILSFTKIYFNTLSH